MSSEVRYRRLGARIRVPIGCVAIGTTYIRYKTEVLTSRRHDNDNDIVIVMARAHNAIIIFTMDMHTPSTIGQDRL